MEETNERTVQDVFDDERENDNRIKELQEEIEMIKEYKEELKECKKKEKILETERKTLAIDLLEDGKLEWIECNLNEWRKYVEEEDVDPFNSDPVKYYIYYNGGSIYKQGYYKGEFQLGEKDSEHFEKYFDDYFYYGYPNYQDVNHPHADGSECYLAFGSGHAWVKSFEWE